ncbi:hypothetical protein RhiXN_11707 [Rhizoctonia solani]|uniref:Uncharacterized protein n=1 Tax=Rhizoctonia solani TaxID=456999 RepID=A0A8H8P5D4_9AGAM|nr:uncharacterized protein RhiXN_11707 [Rhizoctonia solani]QRW24795.1 hypothetical protein RhiXN_11707 [Rhizoctonia solani]
MPQRTAAAVLGLPDSFNGHALAVALLTSMALSLITTGLVAPAAGLYQLFVLIAVAPVTFIYHITIVCLLRKHRDESIKSSLVPECLTRKTNIGVLVLCELAWIAGVAVGFWFYAKYHTSTDMTNWTELAMTSNVIAVLECLVILAVIVFCIRARNEKSQTPGELNLTRLSFCCDIIVNMKGAAAITLLAALPAALAALSSSSLKISDDTLALPASFDPIQAAYWTGLPNHRRTPLPSLRMANPPSSPSSALPKMPFTSNRKLEDWSPMMMVSQSWLHFQFQVQTHLPIRLVHSLNGPGVHVNDGLSASPDMNGDLVYSSESGLYGAYFVVTAYSGWASGHFGDSIQYVNNDGKLQSLPQSSSWGCSHNTGIAFEAASAAPFASVCAEDHGAIWLNTDTRSMNGIKIANENVTNGVSGEPSNGGMSGSYSNLAALDGGRYIFAWQSRGAVNLTPDSWMGDGFTQASPRWLNHNVAIATMDAKNKLAGKQAISTVGAASGDDQVNWLTKESGIDHRNVRVAAAGGQLAVVTWEQLTSPKCEPVPLSCTGTFSGTFAQLVDATGTGSTVGAAVNLGKDVTVSGDIVTIGSKVCWPFVKQTWDISRPKSSGTPVTKMSFACLTTDGTAAKVEAETPTSEAPASTTPAASATATETSIAETGPAATSVAEPTSVAPEPTSAESEPTSVAEPEPTSVAEPQPTSIVEPEVTPAVSETVSAPEASATEPIPSSVADVSSTRRHRPTRYWGRPHGQATPTDYHQQ